MLGFLGLTVGGAVGWWLGEFHGMTLAVVLSGIGSGAGMYLVRRLGERYLE